MPSINLESPKTSLVFFFIVLYLVFGCSGAKNTEQMVTTDFEFISGNKKLSGIIDQPVNGETKALIVFVHGTGNKDIRRENRYFDLRRRFVELGIACVTWDKPGQGRSEGVYDYLVAIQRYFRKIDLCFSKAMNSGPLSIPIR